MAIEHALSHTYRHINGHGDLKVHGPKDMWCLQLLMERLMALEEAFGEPLPCSRPIFWLSWAIWLAIGLMAITSSLSTLVALVCSLVATTALLCLLALASHAYGVPLKALRRATELTHAMALPLRRETRFALRVIRTARAGTVVSGLTMAWYLSTFGLMNHMVVEVIQVQLVTSFRRTPGLKSHRKSKKHTRTSPTAIYVCIHKMMMTSGISMVSSSTSSRTLCPSYSCLSPPSPCPYYARHLSPFTWRPRAAAHGKRRWRSWRNGASRPGSALAWPWRLGAEVAGALLPAGLQPHGPLPTRGVHHDGRGEAGDHPHVPLRPAGPCPGGGPGGERPGAAGGANGDAPLGEPLRGPGRRRGAPETSSPAVPEVLADAMQLSRWDRLAKELGAGHVESLRQRRGP